MNTIDNSRRRFIQQAAAGVAGAALARRSSAAGSLGANDRLRLGIVGFSDRAKDALLPALFELAPSLNLSIAAVADIWSLRRDEGAQFIATHTGERPAVARNTEELYERRIVDAVVISTADFQHALHAVEAMRAGCDVYVEKPLANRMADARLFLDTARETKRIVQVGTQRRSSARVQRVREYLRGGEFGDLIFADIARNANQPGRWRRPDLVNALRQDDTDWTRFLMGRAREAWDPRKYVEFRLFWPYSSGIPDQWMVHDIDTLHFVTGVTKPRSVVASGGVYQWRDGRENPDTLTVVFEYPHPDDPLRGFEVVFSSRMGNSAGTREMYYSNGGSLDVRTGQVTADGSMQERHAKAVQVSPRAVTPRTLGEEAAARRAEIAPANTGVDSALVSHFRNWIECMRHRSAPVADPQAGYDHSAALCMTIEALHSGRRTTFDPERQDVVTS